MLPKSLLPLLVTVLMASSVNAADWWVAPYGAASLFNGHSSGNFTLENPAIAKTDIEASQIESGVGGGVVIGAEIDGLGGYFGLDIEYLGGTKDVVLEEVDPNLGASNLGLNASAIAIGGIGAGEVPWLTGKKFRGLLGFGLGVIKPSGSITLKYKEEVIDPNDINRVTYEDREETADLDMTLYINLFLSEEYSLSKRFGLAGSVGYRATNGSSTSISTKSMSGGYIQEYSGFYVRVGLRIDI
jgi:hypothetical protein